MSLYTVVGAAGFVGSATAAALEADAHEVYAPGRGDPDLFRRELGRVIYCAGLTADYLARPFDTVEAHVTLLARLLQAGRFERLVYLSSTRLYDSQGPAGGREDAALRLTPSEPRHLYDLSKALGENLCLTQGGGRCAVARLSNAFDWRPGAPGFLSEWLQRARRERRLSLDSAAGYVRDYIHLDDVAAALRAIADGGEAAIYNVASGENLSNGELAAVFERCGWSVTFERSVGPQAAPACAVERLAELGVRPRSALAVVEACLKRDDFIEAA
jgi:nucleoside-diphosphate-sugar epimerase